MTPADLRKLMDAATPRPWAADDEDPVARSICGFMDGLTDIYSKSSPFVRNGASDDAALVVAAVNHLPALLALWEAAEDENYHKGTRVPNLPALYVALEKLREVKP